MTKTASFGRRGGAALQPAPPPRGSAFRDEIALTPEQRALLFAEPEPSVAAAKAPAASPRLAANLAALSVTLPVVALNFHLSRGGGDFIALSLGWSFFRSVRICRQSVADPQVLRLVRAGRASRRFFSSGAAISWASAIAAAAIGIGDDLAPALSVPAGGAAAALYCLLAGRARS